MQLFVQLVGKEADVTLYSSDANTFPRTALPASMQYQLKAAFVGMNVLKLLRSGLGLDIGPSFLDHMKFPIWRPPIWAQGKAPKFFTFLGVAQPHVPGSPHPHDYARSSRCVLGGCWCFFFGGGVGMVWYGLAGSTQGLRLTHPVCLYTHTPDPPTT